MGLCSSYLSLEYDPVYYDCDDFRYLCKMHIYWPSCGAVKKRLSLPMQALELAQNMCTKRIKPIIRKKHFFD